MKSVNAFLVCVLFFIIIGVGSSVYSAFCESEILSFVLAVVSGAFYLLAALSAVCAVDSDK